MLSWSSTRIFQDLFLRPLHLVFLSGLLPSMDFVASIGPIPSNGQDHLGASGCPDPLSPIAQPWAVLPILGGPHRSSSVIETSSPLSARSLAVSARTTSAPHVTAACSELLTDSNTGFAKARLTALPPRSRAATGDRGLARYTCGYSPAACPLLFPLSRSRDAPHSHWARRAVAGLRRVRRFV